MCGGAPAIRAMAIIDRVMSTIMTPVTTPSPAISELPVAAGRCSL
jgi:hypothetical protein